MQIFAMPGVCVCVCVRRVQKKLYFSHVMVRILFSLTRIFSLVHTRAERARKILELRYVTVQIFDPPLRPRYIFSGRVTKICFVRSLYT